MLRDSSPEPGFGSFGLIAAGFGTMTPGPVLNDLGASPRGAGGERVIDPTVAERKAAEARVAVVNDHVLPSRLGPDSGGCKSRGHDPAWCRTSTRPKSKRTPNVQSHDLSVIGVDAVLGERYDPANTERAEATAGALGAVRRGRGGNVADQSVPAKCHS
jgi:hypothetical protein